MEEKTATNIKKILKMIRDARKNKGLTHENMAYELNMSPSAYNKLERSETTLSLERLLKIKDILDLSFSDLFELKTSDIYNQDLKDNAIGNVKILYQENKEINKKLIQTLQEEIVFLRGLFKEK
ncbi:helix-turn-helix transcriptional regulator [Flavobacterium franklandianum]|uniref:helix-turn-helix domain-containing protein n=1 Tax=Flavobacterium franklandianum TaxID=2594430 RepID=UPI00117A7C1F|nr:helix-turn-helix transcriptional regulator [Flavobacterium franklandianum]TRX26601.1 helix-turn-helix transcriptional regulator [Flavobacterium franklandianum]